ncbi:GspE/PulE family protein [Planctomycetota bacterium]
MPQVILMSVEYGGYISIVKFLIFLILFFLWLPALNWVYKDAGEVGTKDVYWTAIVFAAGALGTLIWMLVPFFIIGLLVYVGSVGAAVISYISHRNAIVLDFERVLTPEHIMTLFSSKDEGLEEQSFGFITANNNEVPKPEPKTPEFYGHKATYHILSDAMNRRASDIVLIPGTQNYEITYYIDGVAIKQSPLDKSKMDYFLRFIKNLSDIDPEEKRKPQKGKFITSKDKEHIKWEVQTAGSTAGEQVRIKCLAKSEINKLSDIGLLSKDYETLSKIRDAEQALFLVSGPKKSGVTTTFYALIRNHDPFLSSVNTLEKKPSAELANITQNVFNLSDTGVDTYAKKLQEIVRLGADVVGVADCADTKTAKAACEAAQNGKIIYVPLEADSVTEAFHKWVKLVEDKELAINSLLGISNQRLIRKLCEECKQGYQPNKELLRKFSLPPDKAKVLYRAGKVQYDKRGKSRTCQACQGTGFLGRKGVFEILLLDDEQLRRELIKTKSLSQISSLLRRTQMRLLQELMLQKVIEGVTSINEMVRILSKSEKRRIKK